MVKRRTIISLIVQLYKIKSKMAKSHLNTKEISPEEHLKQKDKRTKAPNFSLNRDHDVDNENFPPEELDQALEKFYFEVLILSCQ